jgi:hypothetical protein
MELNRAARAAKEDEDDEDDYDVTGPRVIADVKLAKTIGAYVFRDVGLIADPSL